VLRPREAYGPVDGGAFGVRETFEPREMPDGYYELLGDCYFDGFMDGEAAENADLRVESVVLL
jgi:hypothetical protein